MFKHLSLDEKFKKLVNKKAASVFVCSLAAVIVLFAALPFRTEKYFIH